MTAESMLAIVGSLLGLAVTAGTLTWRTASMLFGFRSELRQLRHEQELRQQEVASQLQAMGNTLYGLDRRRRREGGSHPQRASQP